MTIKMLNRKKIIISVAVLLLIGIVAMLFSGVLFSKKAADNSVIKNVASKTVMAERLSENIELEDSGYTKVAENNGKMLEFNKEWNIFRITELSTGQVWNSAYKAEDIESLSRRDRRLMTALLSVNYSDKSGNEATVANIDNSVSVSYSALKNGIEIIFDFYEQGFIIPLQLWMSDSGFYAGISAESIEENNKDYIIMSVDILPSFGALLSGTDGYIIYPDGPGSLFDCKSTLGKSGIVSAPVYAEPLTANLKKQNDVTIPLPYFGSVVENKSGFSGYILSGSENARINLSLGTAALMLNRIYPTAVYRNTLKVTNSANAEFTISTDRSTEDFCAHYEMLDGENAHYSGIAGAARKLLLSKGILPENKGENTKAPVFLEILMSIRNSSIVSNTMFSMTTYQQAHNILQSLKNQKVENVYTSLLGWQKEGYYDFPASQRFSSTLGSSSQLKKLLSLSNDSDMKILLNSDYVRADASSKNLNVRNDIIYNPLDKAISDATEARYLRNPRVAYNSLLSDIDYFKKNGINGIAFDSFSDYITEDFSDERATTPKEACGFYSAFLKKTAESDMFTASQGGNDYLLKYSDFIYNIPENNSGLTLFDREVPVLQMILHGSVSYAGSLPGNMSSNYEDTYLKWVETGSIPYFLLTHQSASKLKGTEVEDVYNSEFSDWEEEVVSASHSFNNRLSGVLNSVIIKHEEIDKDLICVSYENGKKVYVNYSYEQSSVGNTVIPARDFLVVD